MKFLILTYKDNYDFALQTKYILKKDWDIEAEIIIGYKIGEHYTKYNVICHGFKDKIADVYDEDIYAYIDEFNIAWIYFRVTDLGNDTLKLYQYDLNNI